MKKHIYYLSVLITLMSCTSQSPKQISEDSTFNQDELIEHGRYLVNSIGCDDCHSPKMMTDHGPVPDPATRFAGHIEGDLSEKVSQEALPDWALFNHSLTAAVGPWGISYSANISGDDTGIGLWTEEQFFRAMREGQFKGMEGARKLLPPMPWQNYAKLNDHDLKSIFLYLKSTEPMKNIVPDPVSPDQFLN